MKIFVTLGTQDKQFKRIFEYIENTIESKEISKEDILIIQKGQTKYEFKANLTNSLKKFQDFEFLEPEKLNQILETSDLIITHGGVRKYNFCT